MRFIAVTGRGEVELRYMWLPTFLGLNNVIMQQLDEHVRPLLVGKELTADTLDTANDAVIDFLEKKFPEIDGLRDYLDGLKFIAGD